MAKPATNISPSARAPQARALPLKAPSAVPCPPGLSEALRRVHHLASVAKTTDHGLAFATYLSNQAAACLESWRTEEISVGLAVGLLGVLASSPEARSFIPSASRTPLSTRAAKADPPQ